MKPTYSPKFISTIAALSLCVSSAVADHSDKKWEIKGSNGGSSQSNHTGSDSSSSGTTTISNLESGQKITTQSNAKGHISSLLIEQETNNDKNPTLEVGNADNNHKIHVPKITIKEGASLNRTIENGDQGWNIIFRGGSTIDSFENKGTISSSNKVDTIYLFTDEQTKNGQTKGGQTVVKNFTNNGTIESKDEHAALRLQGAKIETFKNEKLISATEKAVAIKIERKGPNGYDGIIETFINSGTIKGAVFLQQSTIETFINENNGIIEGGSDNGDLNRGGVHAAIYLEAGQNTLKSFENKGTIKAKKAGIFIFGSKDTTITNLKNSGVIEITNGSNGNDSAGILIGQLNTNQESQNQPKPMYETIENTGTIKGGDYGIFIEGGTIKNLKNSETGTIEGKKDGIAFFNGGGHLHTTITNLEIQGIVKGGENGINLSGIELNRRNGTNKNDRIVQNLTIGKDATVEGEKGSGLVLGKVDNNGQNDTYQLTGKIEVNGTLKGTSAAITNYRDMGTEGQDVIVIGEHGKIEGVVRNESGGKLKGNITNNGTGTLAIDNQGTVGDNTVIKNKGNGGSIKILDWKLENQSNGNGNPKTVKFEGNNITLEKLTISETDTDVTKVANAFSTDNNASKASIFANTQVKVSDGNGAVTITGDLLRGLVANIDGSKTAAAALNRTLIATATARATLLDSVMGNALNTLSFLHHKDRASSSLGSYKNANLYANATTIRNDLLSQSSSYA
ncbi:hypothetical protein, partial [Helicobacter sp. 10-6591]|uniref:hypothetical protein n=1 Tax=Helicobacter sp. 10-6591 TaxID=2004998 RepID=UPI000DCE0001